MAEKRRRPGSPKGPRPHLRQYPDDYTHRMYYGFLRMRAQAKFRGEIFELTFDDFRELWGLDYDRRGRASDSLVLTKKNTQFTWSKNNCHIIRRQEQLIRDGGVRRRRPKNWRQE